MFNFDVVLDAGVLRTLRAFNFDVVHAPSATIRVFAVERVDPGPYSPIDPGV